jgi:hypothetical protein
VRWRKRAKRYQPVEEPEQLDPAENGQDQKPPDAQEPVNQPYTGEQQAQPAQPEPANPHYLARALSREQKEQPIGAPWWEDGRSPTRSLPDLVKAPAKAFMAG